MKTTNLTPFLSPLRAVQNLLDAFGGRGVIVGGIAAGLLGEPRFTADVDAVFLVGQEELSKVFDLAAAQGIQTRIAGAEDFAKKNRVLLMRHTESGIDIDISLGMLPFEEEMVTRSQTVELGGWQVRLPTPEDLIIMKAVAHRPKDMLDIQGVLAGHPSVDKDYILERVRQFAEALAMPELLEDLTALLK